MNVDELREQLIRLAQRSVKDQRVEVIVGFCPARDENGLVRLIRMAGSIATSLVKSSYVKVYDPSVSVRTVRIDAINYQFQVSAVVITGLDPSQTTTK